MAVEKISVSTDRSGKILDMEGDIVATVKVTKTTTTIMMRPNLNQAEWDRLRKLIDAELRRSRRSFKVSRFEMVNGIGTKPEKTSGRKSRRTDTAPNSLTENQTIAEEPERYLVKQKYGTISPGGRNPAPTPQTGKSVSVYTTKPWTKMFRRRPV